MGSRAAAASVCVPPGSGRRGPSPFVAQLFPDKKRSLFVLFETDLSYPSKYYFPFRPGAVPSRSIGIRMGGKCRETVVCLTRKDKSGGKKEKEAGRGEWAGNAPLPDFLVPTKQQLQSQFGAYSAVKVLPQIRKSRAAAQIAISSPTFSPGKKIEIAFYRVYFVRENPISRASGLGKNLSFLTRPRNFSYCSSHDRVSERRAKLTWWWSEGEYFSGLSPFKKNFRGGEESDSYKKRAAGRGRGPKEEKKLFSVRDSPIGPRTNLRPSRASFLPLVNCQPES